MTAPPSTLTPSRQPGRFSVTPTANTRLLQRASTSTSKASKQSTATATTHALSSRPHTTPSRVCSSAESCTRQCSMSPSSTKASWTTRTPSSVAAPSPWHPTAGTPPRRPSPPSPTTSGGVRSPSWTASSCVKWQMPQHAQPTRTASWTSWKHVPSAPTTR